MGMSPRKLRLLFMTKFFAVSYFFINFNITATYGLTPTFALQSGGVPYPTLTNSEVCRLLKTGYRMERPDMCSDEV